MRRSDPFQLQLLGGHPEVKDEMVVLSPTAFQEAIDWISSHFSFLYDQQIDWAHDPRVVEGDVTDLDTDTLIALLSRYRVQPQQRVYVAWSYGDFSITLPVHLVGKHLNDIWFPATDDVFVFDPHETWCLELHHEGRFSLGSYELPPSHQAAAEANS